ncbi:MAG: PEP-CTERM sorting domain-containing protein [Phycisphaerae bacterium]|nr:PEP-CTERM sorting domain-containing protein [Phycisphaerae bacterium]
MKLFKMQVLLTLAVLSAAGPAQANWVTLDFPGAERTYAYGIDGQRIVGRYQDSSGRSHGFIYDGTSWTSLDFPGGQDTQAYGVEGSRIVGRCTDADGSHAFLYDGDEWITLDGPGAFITAACGIEGRTVVGFYIISVPEPVLLEAYGFSFDGEDLATIARPGATFTQIFDIDAGNIVGQADDRGFWYDGATWVDVDHPYRTIRSAALGINGENIVGGYFGYLDSPDGRPGEQPAYHGFFFDGANMHTLDFPGSLQTYPADIDALNIVGSYTDASGTHGFIYTIPEPATVLLLGLGGLAVVRRRRGR